MELARRYCIRWSYLAYIIPLNVKAEPVILLLSAGQQRHVCYIAPREVQSTDNCSSQPEVLKSTVLSDVALKQHKEVRPCDSSRLSHFYETVHVLWSVLRSWVSFLTTQDFLAFWIRPLCVEVKTLSQRCLKLTFVSSFNLNFSSVVTFLSILVAMEIMSTLTLNLVVQLGKYLILINLFLLTRGTDDHCYPTVLHKSKQIFLLMDLKLIFQCEPKSFVLL